MTTAWFNELSESLANPEKKENVSIWTSLQTNLDINEYHPCPFPGVVVQEIHEKSGDYFVLKNAQHKTYLRLSPQEFTLWQLIDGKKSVKELVVEHYVSSGSFSRNMVSHLISQLISHHLLVEQPIYTWGAVKAELNNRSWLHKITLPAQALLTQQLKIPGIDPLITFLYRTIGWVFFARPLQLVMALIAVAGLFLFNKILANPEYVLFSQLEASEVALFWAASILPIVIHELGHALTVKHYKREINSGGLMLYFGLPAAYIDTTDIWLENRRARINVTWNGPYTGFVIGGLCSIFMWLYPANAVNSFLFKMASVAYLTILININPLLKYDGYYLLSDALNITFLRERSLTFLQKGLIGKLTRRETLNRDEKIFAVFGILSFSWTVYVLYLVTTIWKLRVSSSLEIFLGSNYSLLTKGLEFLSIGAFISLLALLLLQVLRFALNLINRFVQSGGLQNHPRLAWIGLSCAAIVSIGSAYSFEIYRGWNVVAITSTLSIATLISFLLFNQTYYSSNRWLAHAAFSLTLLSLALIPLTEELMPTGSIHSKYLVLLATAFSSIAGILFILPAIKQLKALQYGIAILTALLLTAAGYFLRIFNWTLILIPLLGMIAALNWFNLRGSARIPALFLIYSGVIFTALSFDLARYIPRYWIIGMMIACAGIWHLILARLPNLSKYEPIISSNKQDAIGYSVSIIVKRVISQVFFESGWGGIESFGKSFSAYTKSLAIHLSINGNQFKDGELSKRATFDLTEVYGVAFDKIYNLMKQRYGDTFSRHIISVGVDLIPWQYREVISELVLARRAWGMDLNEEKSNQRSSRVKLLDRVPLFMNATYDDLRPIAAMLSPRQYAAGQVIIRQGEIGSEFFIIESGKLQVWVQDGEKAAEQVNSLAPGQFFGEAALATEEPRNATIIAETPSILLSLGKSDFDTLIKHHLEFAKKIKANLSNKWILRNMPIFDELDAFDLNFIASKLKSESFKAGEYVFKQGDLGDKFYIIESGEIAVYKEENGISTEIEHHTAGDYFGETALIRKQPRNASIIAVDDCTLFSLAAEDFSDMMGDFQGMRQSLEKTSTRRIKNINTHSEE